MLEAIVLGAIQGISEWLPVSSEGLLVLAQVHLFGSELELLDIIRIALFLHLGTFFAALVYFRHDVAKLLRTLVHFKFATKETKTLFSFLIVSTLISGLVGSSILVLIKNFEKIATLSGDALTFSIGLLLIVTAFLLYIRPSGAQKGISDVRITDSILAGVAQGLSALPGFSRSGSTVSVLLLLKFSDEDSLRMSFLMSLPIVLGGNIILNSKYFTLDSTLFAGLITSFILGLATIHVLLKIARTLSVTWFVGVFGVFMMLAAFL
jgi:undecaprenyl-diphosphatase